MSTSLRGGGTRNAWEVVSASDDDELLVDAVAGSKIRLMAAFVNHGDTTPSSVTFLSKGDGAGTAISPPFKVTANGGFVLPLNRDGWIETVAGEGLAVDTGAGSNTAILITYTRVKG
jgi:hypothetical protein